MPTIKLKEHQIIPINFMKNHRGLILYHSTGSGKTLTALYSLYQFPHKIIIIGPKSSFKTFTDNIKKAQLDPTRFTFYSYTKIKLLLREDIELFKNKSIILDEAHYLRSQKTGNLFITSALSLAYKVLLLTATPFMNHLTDLAVLVNIAQNKNTLPTEKGLFQQLYYYDTDEMANSKLVRQDILEQKLKNTISYYQHLDDSDYPTHTTNYIEVEMNLEQLKEYVYYVHKIIYDNEKKSDILTDFLNIDYSTLGVKKKNIFLMVTRQISNTVNHDPTSPKIQAIYKKIKKGPFPAVIYSNFLKNGIYTIAELLEKDNISYESITGDSTQDKIDSVVNSYNNNKYQVLLLSSAGSESLDLHNTQQIHIMEAHWNDYKIAQVLGRVIRYKSHSKLPKQKRHVEIYRWISMFPTPIENISADQYLRQASENKKILWEQFQKIITKVSIENNKTPQTKSQTAGYHQRYLKYKQEYLLLKHIS